MSINLAHFGLTKDQRDAISPEDFAKPPDEFPCDTQEHLDAAVKLIGLEPDDKQPAIKKRAMAIAKRKGLDLPDTWKSPASMSIEFSFASAADAETVIYKGKVFEAGNYPDKAFDIEPRELSAKASAFKGVDLDLEHSPFKDVLGHKLGKLQSIVVNGTDAIGQLAIPRWLHDLAGGNLKTSLSFDQDKNIVGCALTLNPRIADAQVAAAFAQFAGARNNSADQKSIQDAHDILVGLGANCGANMSRSSTTTTVPPGAKEKTMKVPLKDRLKALFAKDPEAVKEAGIDLDELDGTEFSAKKAEIDPTIQSQLAEFKATNDRLIAGQLQTSATIFADEVIRSAKAVPAQREQIILMFKTAVVADGAGVVKFSDTGVIEEGVNMKALRDLFGNAQPHTLFGTQILNADPNADPNTPNPAMVEKLRSATALGQATKKDGK